MLQNRLIPCLLINNERLIKTFKFDKPNYIGDPLNAIRIFNEKEVDELIIIDIDKKIDGPNFNYIKKLASECFMPLCYGGGITNLDQIKKLVSIGVEKVSLNSAILYNYKLIEETSKLFGAQNVVTCIDINKNLFNKYYVHNNRKLNINTHIKNIINSIYSRGGIKQFYSGFTWAVARASLLHSGTFCMMEYLNTKFVSG